jgi:hypothetical protein
MFCYCKFKCTSAGRFVVPRTFRAHQEASQRMDAMNARIDAALNGVHQEEANNVQDDIHEQDDDEEENDQPQSHVSAILSRWREKFSPENFSSPFVNPSSSSSSITDYGIKDRSDVASGEDKSRVAADDDDDDDDVNDTGCGSSSAGQKAAPELSPITRKLFGLMSRHKGMTKTMLDSILTIIHEDIAPDLPEEKRKVLPKTSAEMMAQITPMLSTFINVSFYFSLSFLFRAIIDFSTCIPCFILIST